MKKGKKAFTLIELIIVITILAILATISFSSISNYRTEAKSTKTEVTLSSIYNKISIVLSTNKVYLKGLLKEPIINNQLTTGTFASGTTLNIGDNYNAGVFNFKVLGENENDYKDIDGNSYIYAYAYDLKKQKFFWQISGIVKNIVGNKKAKVKGYFYKIDKVNDVDGLIRGVDGSASGSVVTNNSVVSFPY